MKRCNIVQSFVLAALIATPVLSYAGFVDDMKDVVRDTGRGIEDLGTDVTQAVSPSEHSRPSDAKITADVNAKLATQPDLPKVTVNTQQGVVFISGTVTSQSQLDRISALAVSIDGVKSVDTSQVTVQP